MTQNLMSKEELYKLPKKAQLVYFNGLSKEQKNQLLFEYNLSKKEALKIFSNLEELEKKLSALTDEEAELIKYDWDFNARPKQHWPQGKWTYWLVLAGRGFGKTRTGAELVKWWIKQGQRYVNIIGATKGDAIDVMIKGESGILNVCNRWERPVFKNNELHWPNGAVSLIFSAEEPERLRGKQHSNLWCDEVGSWRYRDTWDQAMFGLRLGNNPQVVITTTPRPIELIKELVKDPRTIITRGSTYENASNLAENFLTDLVKKYEGTRLGRQELEAELLDKNENALFDLDNIEKNRVKKTDIDGNLIDYFFTRIVVAIDPAVTSSETSDHTGIVVAGKGYDGHYYIIDDLTMLGKPIEWATKAINAYHDYQADRIVAETNNGGDMIENVLRNVDNNISYKKVTATRGKILRAEPIANLYEQNKVHHIGMFKKLEDQMCNFTGDPNQKSPDRFDALVWALTELSSNPQSFVEFIDTELEKSKKSKEKDDEEDIEKQERTVRNKLWF